MAAPHVGSPTRHTQVPALPEAVQHRTSARCAGEDGAALAVNTGAAVLPAITPGTPPEPPEPPEPPKHGAGDPGVAGHRGADASRKANPPPASAGSEGTDNPPAVDTPSAEQKVRAHEAEAGGVHADPDPEADADAEDILAKFLSRPKNDSSVPLVTLGQALDGEGPALPLAPPLPDVGKTPPLAGQEQGGESSANTLAASPGLEPAGSGKSTGKGTGSKGKSKKDTRRGKELESRLQWLEKHAAKRARVSSVWVAARVRGPEQARVGCVAVDARSRTMRLHELNEASAGCDDPDADLSNAVDLGKFQSFGFDNVFDSDATQDQVYDNLGPAMVIKAAKHGIHSTFMAYGQTGSGKSHSTLGGAGNMRGFVPRVLEDTFVVLDALKHKGELASYSVHLGAEEIYRETVRDMLDEQGRVFKSTDHKTSTQIEVFNSSHALQIVGGANECRATSKTLMNSESSRSHLIVSIYIKAEFQNDTMTTMVRQSTITVVDLAGSESLAQSGSESGVQKAEAIKINQSLRALTHFLQLVGDAEKSSKSINPRSVMRESVLTKVLYPRICNRKGKVETCVVFFVCIHPVFVDQADRAISHLHTKNSLRKAKMARDIPVSEKSHTKTFAANIDAQHKHLLALVAAAKQGTDKDKETEAELETLKGQAQSLKKEKQGYLNKLTRMERYIAEAENIISLNLGDGVRALLEIAGKSLSAKFLKKVQQSGYTLQQSEHKVTTEMELLKREFAKMVELMNGKASLERSRALPTRCIDVAAAASTYMRALTLCGRLAASHDKLVRDETNALLAKKNAKKQLDSADMANSLEVIVDDFARLLMQQVQAVSTVDSRQLTSVRHALVEFWPKNTQPVKLDLSKKGGGAKGGFRKLALHIVKKKRHDKCDQLKDNFQKAADTLIQKSVPALSSAAASHSHGASGGGHTMDSCRSRVQMLESFCTQVQAMFNQAHALATKEWGEADTIGQKNQKAVHKLRSDFETTNRNLKATVAKQERKFNHLRDHTETKKTKMVKELTELRDKVEQVEKEKKKLHTTLVQKETSAADLNTQVVQLRKESKTLKQELEKTEDKVLQVESEKKKLRTTLKKKERSAADLGAEVGELREESKTLKLELDKSEDEMQKLARKLSKSTGFSLAPTAKQPAGQNTESSDNDDGTSGTQQGRNDSDSGCSDADRPILPDSAASTTAAENKRGPTEDVTTKDIVFAQSSIDQPQVDGISLEIKELWRLKGAKFDQTKISAWTDHGFKTGDNKVDIGQTFQKGHPPSMGGIGRHGQSALFFTNTVDVYTACVQRQPPAPKLDLKAPKGSGVHLKEHVTTIDVICSQIDANQVTTVANADDIPVGPPPPCVFVSGNKAEPPVYACFDTQVASPVLIVRVCIKDSRLPAKSHTATPVGTDVVNDWKRRLQEQYHTAAPSMYLVEPYTSALLTLGSADPGKQAECRSAIESAINLKGKVSRLADMMNAIDNFNKNPGYYNSIQKNQSLNEPPDLFQCPWAQYCRLVQLMVSSPFIVRISLEFNHNFLDVDCDADLRKQARNKAKRLMKSIPRSHSTSHGFQFQKKECTAVAKGDMTSILFPNQEADVTRIWDIVSPDAMAHFIECRSELVDVGRPTVTRFVCIPKTELTDVCTNGLGVTPRNRGLGKLGSGVYFASIIGPSAGQAVQKADRGMASIMECQSGRMGFMPHAQVLDPRDLLILVVDVALGNTKIIDKDGNERSQSDRGYDSACLLPEKQHAQRRDINPDTCIYGQHQYLIRHAVEFLRVEDAKAAGAVALNPTFTIPANMQHLSVRHMWLNMADKFAHLAKTPNAIRVETLPKTDPAHDEIVRRLGARTFEELSGGGTARLNVTKIESVTNPKLQELFYRRCAELHDPAIENVCTRFHATPAVNVRAIAQNGFMMPAKAGLYGKALYSSNDAVKAQYYTMDNKMFVCRVAVGKHKSVSNTDPTLDASNVLPQFDSVYKPPFTHNDFTEYMVYHPHQMYPVYIVTFSRDKVRIPKAKSTSKAVAALATATAGGCIAASSGATGVQCMCAHCTGSSVSTYAKPCTAVTSQQTGILCTCSSCVQSRAWRAPAPQAAPAPNVCTAGTTTGQTGPPCTCTNCLQILASMPPKPPTPPADDSDADGDGNAGDGDDGDGDDGDGDDGDGGGGTDDSYENDSDGDASKEGGATPDAPKAAEILDQLNKNLETARSTVAEKDEQLQKAEEDQARAAEEMKQLRASASDTKQRADDMEQTAAALTAEKRRLEAVLAEVAKSAVAQQLDHARELNELRRELTLHAKEASGATEKIVELQADVQYAKEAAAMARRDAAATSVEKDAPEGTQTSSKQSKSCNLQ